MEQMFEVTDELSLHPKTLTLEIHGKPVSGSQLKFNRTAGSAYRPTEHKQRVFTIYEYAKNYLAENNLERPYFKKGVPLYMGVEFYFPYRSGDYRTGKYAGEVKPNAPMWVIGNKDLDNLLKPLKDGIKGVLMADDNQICHYSHILKQYSESPRTVVHLGTLLKED